MTQAKPTPLGMGTEASAENLNDTPQEQRPQAVAPPVRLLILSDLHLEFGTFKPPSPDIFDVVVLAGDISPGTKAVHWARQDATFAGKPVVLVPGNHEFYGGERIRTLELLREQAAGTNVHLLDRDEVVIEGVRFLGTTLWTDFALDVERGTQVAQAMRNATRGLNDFAGRIRQRVRYPDADLRFTPEQAAHEHALSRAWLADCLAAPVDPAIVSTSVVVTHHGPSSRSMDPQYEGSPLNPCFYSELPEGFFQVASLWVHGHTHSSMDYLHHRTRVVANPRGYRLWSGANENHAFTSDLVIEAGSGGGHG